MKKSLIYNLTFILLLIVVFAGFLFIAVYSMQETVYTKRGTFDYHVLLDWDVKRVPVISQITEESFYYSCGDGPKPAMQEISYRSSESIQTIRFKLNDYFGYKGYQKEVNRHGESYFQKRNTSVSISLEDLDSVTAVSVLFSW